MGKKTKIEPIAEVSTPRFTPEQYWEWRTTIAELDTAKKHLEVSMKSVELAKKEAEIVALKAQVLALSTLKAAQKLAAEAEQDYTITKKRFEGILGLSLSGKLIDAHTFEIKDAPSSGESS
jgi:hypothetical protein